VKSASGIEYDQRVIIQFFWNEVADARNIAAKLQAQFVEHAYELQPVQFWITEIWLGLQDLHYEVRI
jgi:hypothetical protein